MYFRGFRIFQTSRYQGIVKATVSRVLEPQVLQKLQPSQYLDTNLGETPNVFTTPNTPNGRPNQPKHIGYFWKKPYNLFVTSKNETTNSPIIHELKELQNVFKMKKQGLNYFF